MRHMRAGPVFPCGSKGLAGSAMAIRAMGRSGVRQGIMPGRGAPAVIMRKSFAPFRVRKSVLCPRTHALLNVDRR